MAKKEDSVIGRLERRKVLSNLIEAFGYWPAA